MQNLRNGKLTKIIYKIRLSRVRFIKCISEVKYIKLYKKLLLDYGMHIEQDGSYIDPSAYFDNYDYSQISIGKHVTISRDVLFLTHDWSISTGLRSIEENKNAFFLKGIVVSDNVFIGARTIILPGTTIGSNVIIGAASVVKGTIPNGAIVIGNPAKIIGSTNDFAKEHIDKGDYLCV